ARIGIDRAVNRRPSGSGKGDSGSPVADFINGAETAAEFNSSSTEPDSATSSKHSSAAAVVARRSADSVDVRRRQSAAPMSKPISWSRLKKHCTVRHERSLCAGLGQIRWKLTRLRSRVAFMKDSESGYVVRAKLACAAEKAAISFFGFAWRDIQISQLKAAI